MPVGIEMIEYYLPDRTITSEELASNFGFDLVFVEKNRGKEDLYCR